MLSYFSWGIFGCFSIQWGSRLRRQKERKKKRQKAEKEKVLPPRKWSISNLLAQRTWGSHPETWMRLPCAQASEIISRFGPGLVHRDSVPKFPPCLAVSWVSGPGAGNQRPGYSKLEVLEEEQLLMTKPKMWAWKLETEVEMRTRMFKVKLRNWKRQ